MSLEVVSRDGAMHIAHGAGEEPEAIGDGRYLLVSDLVDRLAAIQSFELGEVFELRFNGPYVGFLFLF